MNVSYNWLKEYIDIPYSPEELAEKLTMAGIEVEAISQPIQIPEGIVVGEILERNPHPDADKLSVCKVSDGKEELQVVCGAPNCDVGKKVPLATVGTVFPDPEGKKDFVIKKSKLRGVESYGMLCSSKELGLDGDHNGLMELDSESETGKSFAEIVKADTVFEVEITPNRPDWLSQWGVARDIAALTGNTPKMPVINERKPESIEEFSNLVDVKNSDLCPRYTARVIRNVTVKESPDWLKQHLNNIGLRPINNIVDITNFVLHELGHPLHAFDLALLNGPQIVVRNAEEGEKIVALDEKEYELKSHHLVIADAEKPVALAGIMGGEHSGVTETTTDILLESAAFCQSNIRHTSRELGISSDSSYRFERGIDFNMVETASDRATDLILELTGGTLVTELVDVKVTPDEPTPIKCRYQRINKLLGINIAGTEICRIFSDLGLIIEETTDEYCIVKAPSFRHDIEREADLAEEVARIHGLEDIPVVPIRAQQGGTIRDDAYAEQQQAREELISLGLYEAMTLSLTEVKTAELDPTFGDDDIVKVANPLSLGLECLRPTLFGPMLHNVEYNIARKNTEVALFEMGNVFCANKKLYPEERYEVCIALTGKKHPERFSAELESVYDFFDLKGLIEEWFSKRRFQKVEFKACEDPKFDAGCSAEVLVNNKKVGVLGQVAAKYTKDMRIKTPLFMAVLQLDDILKVKTGKLYYEPISPFPSVERDVAFIADESIQHKEIVDFITKLKLKNFVKVELFDIFRDENIGEGKKSMAYAITFCNPEKTLTDKEVNKAYEFLRKKMQSDLNITLR